jgi:hypothetical protein
MYSVETNIQTPSLKVWVADFPSTMDSDGYVISASLIFAECIKLLICQFWIKRLRIQFQNSKAGNWWLFKNHLYLTSPLVLLLWD